MKKALLSLAIIGVLWACGGGDSVTLAQPPAGPVQTGQFVDGIDQLVGSPAVLFDATPKATLVTALTP
jgi:hypothetical protein